VQYESAALLSWSAHNLAKGQTKKARGSGLFLSEFFESGLLLACKFKPAPPLLAVKIPNNGPMKKLA
jgi:hypothetical protein